MTLETQCEVSTIIHEEKYLPKQWQYPLFTGLGKIISKFPTSENGQNSKY